MAITGTDWRTVTVCGIDWTPAEMSEADLTDLIVEVATRLTRGRTDVTMATLAAFTTELATR